MFNLKFFHIIFYSLELIEKVLCVVWHKLSEVLAQKLNFRATLKRNRKEFNASLALSQADVFWRMKKDQILVSHSMLIM
jgi:hypothetical protein